MSFGDEKQLAKQEKRQRSQNHRHCISTGSSFKNGRKQQEILRLFKTFILTELLDKEKRLPEMRPDDRRIPMFKKRIPVLKNCLAFADFYIVENVNNVSLSDAELKSFEDELEKYDCFSIDGDKDIPAFDPNDTENIMRRDSMYH